MRGTMTKFLMNFSTSADDVGRYASPEDLRHFYESYGISGLEVMPLPGQEQDMWKRPEDCPVIGPGMAAGVHTCSVSDWMSLDREWLLRHYRKDLQYARHMKAEYVVFHVSQVSMEESFTWQMRHTDEEVIDASCGLINELLEGQEASFWFLLENLWWPGLTFRDPACTKRLLDGISYEKKGLMLDTGHFLHTDLTLSSQEEALRALHGMLDAHGELVSDIRGIHLNQSLTGTYVRNWLKNPQPLPEDPDERFCRMYEHIFAIDRHEPFTDPGVCALVERIDPLYVTYEYITRSRGEHAEYLREGSGRFYAYFT